MVRERQRINNNIIVGDVCEYYGAEVLVYGITDVVLFAGYPERRICYILYQSGISGIASPHTLKVVHKYKLYTP
jgi:hypothetical protein